MAEPEPAIEPAPEAGNNWSWIYMETSLFRGPLRVPAAALAQWHTTSFGINFSNHQGTVPPSATPPESPHHETALANEQAADNAYRPAVIPGLQWPATNPNPPPTNSAASPAAVRAPAPPTGTIPEAVIRQNMQLQRAARTTQPAASSSEPPPDGTWTMNQYPDPTPSTDYSMNPALLEMRWDRTGWNDTSWRQFYTDNAVDPAETSSNTAFSSAASTPMPSLVEPTTSAPLDPTSPPEEEIVADPWPNHWNNSATWGQSTWGHWNDTTNEWETTDHTSPAAAQITPSEVPPTPSEAPPNAEVPPTPSGVPPSTTESIPTPEANVWANWQSPPQPTTEQWRFLPHTDIHYDAANDKHYWADTTTTVAGHHFVCIFWATQNGRCRNGEGCSYQHCRDGVYLSHNLHTYPAKMIKLTGAIKDHHNLIQGTGHHTTYPSGNHHQDDDVASIAHSAISQTSQSFYQQQIANRPATPPSPMINQDSTDSPIDPPRVNSVPDTESAPDIAASSPIT